MPNLPSIPGKDLVTGTTTRVRLLVGGAALGALVAGGAVVKKVRGAKAGEDPTKDPIAETVTAPPGADNEPDPADHDPPAEPKVDTGTHQPPHGDKLDEPS